MTGLPLQVNDGPVFLPLLNVVKVEIDRFVPSNPAGQQGIV
jgi:hypothetical protein